MTQARPKWYQSPDGEPQHPRYWMNLTLAATALVWVLALIARVIPATFDGPALPDAPTVALMAYLPIVVIVVLTVLAWRTEDQPPSLRDLSWVLLAMALLASILQSAWIALGLAVATAVLLVVSPTGPGAKRQRAGGA